MTSPNTTPTSTSPASTSATTDKPRTGLSAVQVAASALAAVSSAVLLSFLGVAGTLIGAALASIVSTVGASLYSSSLQKTNERLRRARRGPAVRPEPATTVLRPLPTHLDPRRAPAKSPRVRWARVPVYAAAVFVVAMGVITGVELIGQKPVSAMVTQSTSTGTTLGDLGHASSSSGDSTGTSDRTGTTDGTTTDAPATATTTAPATATGDNAPTTAAPKSTDDPTPSTSAATSSAPATRSAAPTTAAPKTGAPKTAAPTTAAAPTS